MAGASRVAEATGWWSGRARCQTRSRSVVPFPVAILKTRTEIGHHNSVVLPGSAGRTAVPHWAAVRIAGVASNYLAELVNGRSVSRARKSH